VLVGQNASECIMVAVQLSDNQSL